MLAVDGKQTKMAPELDEKRDDAQYEISYHSNAGKKSISLRFSRYLRRSDHKLGASVREHG